MDRRSGVRVLSAASGADRAGREDSTGSVVITLRGIRNSFSFSCWTIRYFFRYFWITSRRIFSCGGCSVCLATDCSILADVPFRRPTARRVLICAAAFTAVPRIARTLCDTALPAACVVQSTAASVSVWLSGFFSSCCASSLRYFAVIYRPAA